MYECPSTEALEAMGFDFNTTFGMEFEFYCVDGDREDVANHLTYRTGVDVSAEHYNHTTRSYWKIVTDASLGEEDGGEYDCYDCECERECDSDCSNTCNPTYDCDNCLVHTWEENGLDEAPECDDCQDLCEDVTYECEDCEQDRYCDECCSDHCDRGPGSGGAGMELVSPILKGREGVAQMYDLLNALRDLDVMVDNSCGLHIHLDGGSFTHRAMKNLAALAMKYEPTIDSILPESRRHNSNCKSMCSRRWGQDGGSRLERLARKFAQVESAEMTRHITDIWNDRYVKVNFEALRDHGTVEFRQHGGTLNADKTLQWVTLCMQMKRRAMRRPSVRMLENETYPALETMMDELRFGEECRVFWTERRDLFAEDVARNRTDEEREELRQAARRAQCEHDERVRMQEQLRWNAESDANPAVPLMDVLHAEPVEYSLQYFTHPGDEVYADWLFGVSSTPLAPLRMAYTLNVA